MKSDGGKLIKNYYIPVKGKIHPKMQEFLVKHI